MKQNLIMKLGVGAAVGLLGLQVALPVLAAEASTGANVRAGARPGLLRDFVRGKGRAVIGTGVLKSKSGDTPPATLVVSKDGKDYNVNVDANTQLRRRFWGKATLSEMSVGDSLNVIGIWADDAHTTINAKLVRDASIQKRFGVFLGTVSSLSANGWVMATLNRGSQTVTVSATTQFVNRKGQVITQADVKVGDKVRVRGLWDNKLNTITEVTHVKDFTVPAR